MEWNIKWQIPIPELAQVQKDIFKQAKNFLDECSKGNGKDQVESLFYFFNKNWTTLLEKEEQFMSLHGLPPHNPHQQDHAQLKNRMGHLIQRLSKEGATLPLLLETNQWLIGGVLKHMADHDAQLSRLEPGRENSPPLN
ncbi:MAG: hypothetical protein OEV94_04050 [Deltaproteobacteria bacterium]|nr:hypothetical protein [Deltaproteobacteria bacterium]